MSRRIRQIRERQGRIGSPPPRRVSSRTRPEDYSGGGYARWAVVREADEEAGVLRVHYLRNRFNPPRPGEDEAYGSLQDVHPQPGQKMVNYDMKGVVTPLVGELEDETLGFGFVPVLVVAGRRAILLPAMPRGVKTLSTTGQATEGSGV